MRPASCNLSCFVSTDVVPECEKSSATTYYWYREALDISNSISEGGGLYWKMTLCLLAAWTLVCLAMIKGIQSSGKVRKVLFRFWCFFLSSAPLPPAELRGEKVLNTRE